MPPFAVPCSLPPCLFDKAGQPDEFPMSPYVQGLSKVRRIDGP